MDLTILTCNYETPHQIKNLLKSVYNTSSELPKVVVMNTGKTDASDKELEEDGIPYYNFRGATHAEAVNLGFHKVTTRYVLLVDSDVIFLRDLKNAFEIFKSYDFTLMGKVVGDCGGKQLYSRVEPWYCFIDLDRLKHYRIKFSDHDRVKESKANGGRVYDIGSTMFEDVAKYNLTVGDVTMENKFFKHYGGMSWRMQSYDPTKGDTDIDFGGTHPHKVLYDIGLKVKETYDKETASLKDVDIKNKFA